MKLRSIVGLVLCCLLGVHSATLAQTGHADIQAIGDSLHTGADSVQIAAGGIITIELFATDYSNIIQIDAMIDVSDPSAIVKVESIKKSGFSFPPDGSAATLEGSRITFSQGGLSGLTQTGPDLKFLGLLRVQLSASFTSEFSQPLTFTFSELRFASLTGTTQTITPGTVLTVSPLPGPQLQLTTASLSFPSVRTGRTDTLTFWIRNPGGSPLSGTVGPEDQDSGDAPQPPPPGQQPSPVAPAPIFSYSPRSFAIPPQDSLLISVVFAPGDTIAYTDSLAISSNDPTMPSASLALSGSGYTIVGHIEMDLDPAPGNQGLTEIQASIGDTVGVEVYLVGAPQVRGAGVSGKYDGAGITALEPVVAGTFFLNATYLLRTPSAGLELGAAVLDVGTSIGTGWLATIPFRVTATEPGTSATITLDLLGYTLPDGTLDEKPIAASVTITAILRGDFDLSGRVDFRDFLLFASAYGTISATFDLNANGLVDFPDFVIFVRSYQG